MLWCLKQQLKRSLVSTRPTGFFVFDRREHTGIQTDSFLTPSQRSIFLPLCLHNDSWPRSHPKSTPGSRPAPPPRFTPLRSGRCKQKLHLAALSIGGGGKKKKNDLLLFIGVASPGCFDLVQKGLGSWGERLSVFVAERCSGCVSRRATCPFHCWDASGWKKDERKEAGWREKGRDFSVLPVSL